VSSKAPSAPGVAPDVTGVDVAAFRWMGPLAVAAIGVVVTAAFQTHPTPGLHGQHLAVSATLLVFATATVGVVRLPETSWCKCLC
jgi:hypothetical protein